MTTNSKTIGVVERTATHITVRMPIALTNVSDGLWMQLPELGTECHALAKDNHVILCLGDAGCVAVHRHALRTLAATLVDLADAWEGVAT